MDVIEEAEGGAMIAILAILGLVAFLLFKSWPDIKKWLDGLFAGGELPDKVQKLGDMVIGGRGQEGDPEYVSWQDNLKGWIGYAFPKVVADSPDTPVAPAPVTPALNFQAQSAMSEYDQAMQNADGDLGNATTNWLLNNKVF
jgi:hypothetical protein